MAFTPNIRTVSCTIHFQCFSTIERLHPPLAQTMSLHIFIFTFLKIDLQIVYPMRRSRSGAQKPHWPIAKAINFKNYYEE